MKRRPIAASYGVQRGDEPTSAGGRNGSVAVSVPDGIEAMAPQTLTGTSHRGEGRRSSHRKDAQATAIMAVAIPPPSTKSTPRSPLTVPPPLLRALFAATFRETRDGGGRRPDGVIVRLTESPGWTVGAYGSKG
jgi:hypothetical protein